MTQPTLEQLEEQHEDAWNLLRYSATHSLSQNICDSIAQEHRKASDAYFQTKYKRAFELVK